MCCAGWVGGSIRERLTKAVRAAAAPKNTFAAYRDRDDLSVCKHTRENGDGASSKLEASLKCRSCGRGRYARPVQVIKLSSAGRRAFLTDPWCRRTIRVAQFQVKAGRHE